MFWIQQKARKCLWLFILLLYIRYIRGRLRSETRHFKEMWKVKVLRVFRFRVPCRLCNVRTGLRKKRRTGNSGFCVAVVVVVAVVVLACQLVRRLQQYHISWRLYNWFYFANINDFFSCLPIDKGSYVGNLVIISALALYISLVTTNRT
jgi:hypothetical protein